MFGKKPPVAIRSLLAAGCSLSGDLRFRDGLRIDGEVAGSLRGQAGVPSLLVISETGSVEGEVVADHVIVDGRIRGPVHARELLELQPHARIDGDVAYGALAMAPGAVIAGQLRPLAAGEEMPLLQAPARTPPALESPGMA